jgi:hypothetical protein
MDDVAAAPSGAQAASEPGLRLEPAQFSPERRLVMAIVNRPPDFLELTRRLGELTTTGARVGARIFRAPDVRATRQALDRVAAIRGDPPPARAVRGIA